MSNQWYALKYLSVEELFHYLATEAPGQQNDTVKDDKHAVISKMIVCQSHCMAKPNCCMKFNQRSPSVTAVISGGGRIDPLSLKD